MAYFWVKSLHLLFVVAWLAAVFYLPRILLNINECEGQPTVQERLVLMGKRLYRFGHVMFGFTGVFGMTLWVHFGMKGTWLQVKLLLVALLFAYFILTGVMLKRFATGGSLMSNAKLRWYNELPVFLAFGAIYLVIAKPF